MSALTAIPLFLFPSPFLHPTLGTREVTLLTSIYCWTDVSVSLFPFNFAPIKIEHFDIFIHKDIFVEILNNELAKYDMFKSYISFKIIQYVDGLRFFHPIHSLRQ